MPTEEMRNLLRKPWNIVVEKYNMAKNTTIDENISETKSFGTKYI